MMLGYGQHGQPALGLSKGMWATRSGVVQGVWATRFGVVQGRFVAATPSSPVLSIAFSFADPPFPCCLTAHQFSSLFVSSTCLICLTRSETLIFLTWLNVWDHHRQLSGLPVVIHQMQHCAIYCVPLYHVHWR